MGPQVSSLRIQNISLRKNWTTKAKICFSKRDKNIKSIVLYINSFVLYIKSLVLYIKSFVLYIKSFVLYIKSLVLYIKSLVLYIKSFMFYIKLFVLYIKSFTFYIKCSCSMSSRLCLYRVVRVLYQVVVSCVKCQDVSLFTSSFTFVLYIKKGEDCFWSALFSLEVSAYGQKFKTFALSMCEF